MICLRACQCFFLAIYKGPKRARQQTLYMAKWAHWTLAMGFEACPDLSLSPYAHSNTACHPSLFPASQPFPGNFARPASENNLVLNENLLHTSGVGKWGGEREGDKERDDGKRKGVLLLGHSTWTALCLFMYSTSRNNVWVKVFFFY